MTTTSTKIKNRKIKISCKLVREIYELFRYFSSQLSDGYFEGFAGPWGTYKDEYYPDIWQCFDFTTVTKARTEYFVITLKARPTYDSAKADCIKMHSWSDTQITDYLRSALIDTIDDYGYVFDKYDSDKLKSLIEIIKDWTIVCDPLPKMTHKQLV